MINAVTPVTNAQPARQAQPVAKNAPVAKPRSAHAGHDAVHLSPAAQTQASLVKAAAQEATETPAQTAKEAQGGDRQAQRLLAQEAAAKPAGGK